MEECCLCKELISLENHTTNYVLLSKCFHGMCRLCWNRLLDINKQNHQNNQCPICRNAFSTEDVLENIPKELYEMVIHRDYCPAKRNPYEALFSPLFKDVYLALRHLLCLRWNNVHPPELSSVCAICVIITQYNILEEEILLLNLFYSCSVLTKSVILDILTVLYLCFSVEICNSITPKDVFFHFFLKMCSLKHPSAASNGSQKSVQYNCKRPLTNENDQMAIDRTLFFTHQLMFDTVDLDGLHQTLTMMTDISSACGCNKVQETLRGTIAVYNQNKSLNGVDKTTLKDNTEEEDEEDDVVICGINSAGKHKDVNLLLENAYKWETDFVWEKKKDIQPKEDEDKKEEVFMVNCLDVYLSCLVCNHKMSSNVTGPFGENILQEIENRLMHENIETAVCIVGMKHRLKEEEIKILVNHFTDTRCFLNDMRFIPFLKNIIKHPVNLKNHVFIKHLYHELFLDKKSTLCPVYYLAALSKDAVLKDCSPTKKIKKDVIHKKLNTILRKHVLM